MEMPHFLHEKVASGEGGLIRRGPLYRHMPIIRLQCNLYCIDVCLTYNCIPVL